MEDKKPKVTKTIKLEDDLNNRLNSLCEHLGVTPHSYLISKVGEAISRDEVSYLAALSAAEANAKMTAFFNAATAQMEEES